MTVPEDGWHGWQVPDGWQDTAGRSLHIGYLRGRGSPVLYIYDGTSVRTLAHFPRAVGDDGAVEAVAMLDALIVRAFVVENPNHPAVRPEENL